jgi:hypothetical protein
MNKPRRQETPNLPVVGHRQRPIAPSPRTSIFCCSFPRQRLAAAPGLHHRLAVKG